MANGNFNVSVGLYRRTGTVANSGRSHKAFTTVTYDSRVVITSKFIIFTTLEMLITIIGAL